MEFTIWTAFMIHANRKIPKNISVHKNSEEADCIFEKRLKTIESPWHAEHMSIHVRKMVMDTKNEPNNWDSRKFKKSSHFHIDTGNCPTRTYRHHEFISLTKTQIFYQLCDIAAARR